MKVLISLALFCLFLDGCASPSATRYWSEYRVGQSGGLSAEEAELAHKSLATNGAMADAGRRFDTPPKLLRAPQPAMSREDIDAQVTGEVVVQIYFNERGFVEKTVVLQSTKASLTESVIAAVSQWQISPVTRKGSPAGLVARQAFSFKTEW
jgi:TonB family protein